MGKRKRPNAVPGAAAVAGPHVQSLNPQKKHRRHAPGVLDQPKLDHVFVQLVTGSYERILHGFSAAVHRDLLSASHDQATEHAPSPPASKAKFKKEKHQKDSPPVLFADTFLFHAHASSIRCLAISPPTPSTAKVTLATGGTDERINLYACSTVPPPFSDFDASLRASSALAVPQSATPTHCRSRQIGTLLHHTSPITTLAFPSRSKLISTSAANEISITRARDWTPLSTLHSPIPTPSGRPSGDTAGPGDVPTGINALAVHPSLKLMVTVARGERCMRLWNLVTGRKAGVLSFGRDMLAALGEGPLGRAEGRSVVWEAEGAEFVVGFERGAVVFGLDSRPKSTVLPSPLTKLHKACYLPLSSPVLALATEDGRILFYDTNAESETNQSPSASAAVPPSARFLAQLGGPAAGLVNRVKDFVVLPVEDDSGEEAGLNSKTMDAAKGVSASQFIIAVAHSNGQLRLWALSASALRDTAASDGSLPTAKDSGFTTRQIGRLVGVYETGVRITCLAAFIMDGVAPDGEEEAELMNGAGSGRSGDSDEGSDE